MIVGLTEGNESGIVPCVSVSITSGESASSVSVRRLGWQPAAM
jgi:hypothetical protein